MTLREEVEQLAKAESVGVDWDDRGWCKLIGHRLPDMFMPPEIVRKALLPSGHPEATKIRPGAVERGEIE